MSHATQSDPGSIARRTSVAVGLVIGAVIVGNGLALLALLAFALAGVSVGSGGTLVLALLASQVGILLVGLGFVWGVEDPSFVPLRRPTLGELQVGALALGAALAAELIRRLLVAFTSLGEAGTVPIPDDAGAAALLVVVAGAILLAPPIEELLFRGIVQRYVHEVSSARVGIAVATVLFVPVHGAGILLTDPTLAAAIAVVATLTVVSVALGVAYARTDNLVVPIAVHAGYNALSALIPVAVSGL